MPWFEVHTDESVHGMYYVEANDADHAKRKFEESPHEIGEQKLYEAYSAEVIEVKKCQH